MANILVVDDELGIRDLLFEILNDEGHTVELAENAAQARQARQLARPDLVLLDTIDTAVEATRIGALAFLEKPITLQKLLKAVEQALQKKPAPTISHHGAASGASFSSNALPGSGALYPPGQNPLRTQVPGTLNSRAGSLSGAPQSNMVHGVQQGSGFVNDGHAYGVDAGAHMGAMHLSATQQVFELDQPLREARDAFEKAYFEFHLVQEGGSMTRVAEKTGLERTHLYRKLKQLGVDLSKTKRSLGH